MANKIDREVINNLKKEARSQQTLPKRLMELAGINDELAAIVASNVSTPPELLKQLADRQNKTVVAAVVSNPNTPTETLFSLGEYYPQELLANPILEVLFLENINFAREMTYKTLLTLLKQQNIPKFLLQSIITHTEETIIEEAKLHVDCTGEMNEGWHEAAAEKIKQIYFEAEEICFEDGVCHYVYHEDFIRDFQEFLSPRLIAINKIKIYLPEMKDDPQVLAELAEDPDEDVRSHVAENCNTPIHVLEQLASHEEYIVKISVAYNSLTPISTLEKLADDLDEDIRLTVAKNCNTPISTLKKLADDKSKYIRESVARHPNITIDILKRLANDKDVSVRYAVARHPNITIDIIKKLANDENTYVIREVVRNIKTPIDILERINIDGHDIHDCIAGSPKTPAHILEKIPVDRDIHLKYKLACNSNTSKNKSCTIEIKKIIFQNFGKSKESSFIRFIVFMSDDAEIEDLAANYNSTDWLERYAIAQNLKTPPETLKLLVKDCNRIVRATAKENLSRMNYN